MTLLRRIQACKQTLLSPKVDPVDLAVACYKAGWRERNLVTAVALAGTLSQYRLKAIVVNDCDSDGDAVGLFQICTECYDLGDDPYDMDNQAATAYHIFCRFSLTQARRGFRAWGAFRAGDHTAWLARAQRAVAEAMGRLAGDVPPS